MAGPCAPFDAGWATVTAAAVSWYTRRVGETEIRRKYTLRIGERKVVFVKRSHETVDHVIGKAVLVALYASAYPDLQVEASVGGRYKPDAASWNHDGTLRFWGESGVVATRKIGYLLRKYPDTHVVFLRHSKAIDAFARLVERAATGARRTRPVEVIGRPSDIEPFIGANGAVRIRREDCTIRRISGNGRNGGTA